MDKLLEVLAGLVSDMRDNKYPTKPLIIAFSTFLIIFIGSLYLGSIASNNEVFNRIGEASFYIIASLIFIGLLGYGQIRREEKNEATQSEEVENLIKLTREAFGNTKGIKLFRRKPQAWGGWLLKINREKPIEVGYSFDMQTGTIENFWIYSTEQEIIDSLLKGKGIEDSSNEYKAVYTDNLKNTIIPTDSQQLAKNDETQMLELLKRYIKEIETLLKKQK